MIYIITHLAEEGLHVPTKMFALTVPVTLERREQKMTADTCQTLTVMIDIFTVIVFSI